MSASVWARLGNPHQCHPTAALGLSRAHEAPLGTEFWCPDCHRLWSVTKTHHAIRGRSLCGCGWVLVGECTNAEALDRWGAWLASERVTLIPGPPGDLDVLAIAAIRREHP